MYIKFSSIFDASNYKKRINVQCLVTGKMDEPYTIPKKIKLTCQNEEGCGTCAVPSTELEVSAENENVMHFIDVSQNQFSNIIKRLVKRQCKTLQFEIKEVQNVERIFISQPTGRYREKNANTHVAYMLGYGIDSNYNYDFSGVPTIDPNTQITTVVFDKAKKLKTDIETFKLSTAVHEKLKKFQIENATPEKIFDHLHKLYDTYAHNITQIYQRFDLHLAIDMAFRTVISFRFANEYVHKGWADIIVAGDSRTGKGFVSERLAIYFNVGEVASADNCSHAGLIAGLEQHRGHWAVSWGRIPLNDLGLLILDEASNLKEDWTKLTRVRSEGIASVDKIIKQTTNARTRLISLCNPHKRKIAQFSHGVQAIADVVETPEDIARFDYALIVSDNEFNTDEVNQIRSSIPEIYSQEDEQNLIMWTWSRQTDDIKFTEEAINEIYALARRISKMYVSDIPLIQGANVRIKLAKLAVAFAARLYSCADGGKSLLVDGVHVNCAYIMLNTIYKKPACGYYTMSQIAKSMQIDVNDDDMSAVAKYIGSFVKDKTELCKCLINNNIITVKDIAEHLNFSQEIAQEVISKLLKHNMIVKKFQNTYVKNRHFTEWLKIQVLKDNKVEES